MIHTCTFTQSLNLKTLSWSIIIIITELCPIFADKITIEELIERRHVDGRVHWKLPIIKHASFKWKDIAMLIGFNAKRVKALEEQYKDSEVCLKQALITNFIQNKPGNYSQDMNGFAELLNDVGLKRLAERILAILFEHSV